MKNKAVRLYGVDDLRLDEFDLPEIRDDEILVKIVSDSICMSTYKLLKQGKAHKRAPQDMDVHPVIVGHEFAGDIVQVGAKWQDKYRVGEKFAQQPALNYHGSLNSPGYSYRWCGGSAQYCIMPPEVMELGCLFPYNGDAYFESSLSEPFCCIIGGYNVMYHTNKVNYNHAMNIKPGGNVLILGGGGPMGLGAIEYALHAPNRPKRLVMVDVDEHRIERAKRYIPYALAAEQGAEFKYINSTNYPDIYATLSELVQGEGYDDVFVYAPIVSLAELGDKLLAFDGCMNVFAGPSDKSFSAQINLYNAHYTSTHILGSTGGNIDDQKEMLTLTEQHKLRPALMVSHICGIDHIAEAIENLPKYSAGKILTYPILDHFPLVAIDDFEQLAHSDDELAPLYAQLHEVCEKHSGLWNAEAEKILLSHFNV
jgi:threonine dehydrogenase-like Zn-dependent dehydrogenase